MPALNTSKVVEILADVTQVLDQPRDCDCVPRAITDQAAATLRQAIADLGRVAHYEQQAVENCTHPGC